MKCSAVTPEAVETLAVKLGNVTILSKGPSDIISDGISLTVSDEQGNHRSILPFASTVFFCLEILGQ